MAYNKADIIDKALRAIEEHGVRKITHLVQYLPIASSTFYEWELEKSEAILSKIHEQRIKRKVKMLDRWEESNNPALEIAAFKLLADTDELEALSTTKVKQENTHELKGKPRIIFDFGTENTADKTAEVNG
jgi:hypothetical protein